MDEKWMGFVRHALNTMGALLMAWGLTDEATWGTVMGSLMVLVPFVWSWMSKA